MEWDTRFDLRRVLGGTERTVLSEFYGIDPSTIRFVDVQGEEIELSKLPFPQLEIVGVGTKPIRRRIRLRVARAALARESASLGSARRWRRRMRLGKQRRGGLPPNSSFRWQTFIAIATVRKTRWQNVGKMPFFRNKKARLSAG